MLPPQVLRAVRQDDGTEGFQGQGLEVQRVQLAPPPEGSGPSKEGSEPLGEGSEPLEGGPRVVIEDSAQERGRAGMLAIRPFLYKLLERVDNREGKAIERAPLCYNTARVILADRR